MEPLIFLTEWEAPLVVEVITCVEHTDCIKYLYATKIVISILELLKRSSLDVNFTFLVKVHYFLENIVLAGLSFKPLKGLLVSELFARKWPFPKMAVPNSVLNKVGNDKLSKC